MDTNICASSNQLARLEIFEILKKSVRIAALATVLCGKGHRNIDSMGECCNGLMFWKYGILALLLKGNQFVSNNLQEFADAPREPANKIHQIVLAHAEAAWHQIQRETDQQSAQEDEPERRESLAAEINGLFDGLARTLEHDGRNAAVLPSVVADAPSLSMKRHMPDHGYTAIEQRGAVPVMKLTV